MMNSEWNISKKNSPVSLTIHQSWLSLSFQGYNCFKNSHIVIDNAVWWRRRTTFFFKQHYDENAIFAWITVALTEKISSWVAIGTHFYIRHIPFKTQFLHVARRLHEKVWVISGFYFRNIAYVNRPSLLRSLSVFASRK